MMTPNCANTISKHGQGFEEIRLQGKDLHNSRKVVMIYKTNKLVFFQKLEARKKFHTQKVVAPLTNSLHSQCF